MLRTATILLVLLFVTACSQTVEHIPLSAAEYRLLDYADAGGQERWWGDTEPPELISDTIKVKRGPNTEENLLAISGGGANGAFGAGVLIGWQESGERPDFKIVTGVSTGAIIAPFAFLGPEYDDVLRAIYSTTTKDNVYQPKLFTGLIAGSAVSDTKSLRDQIRKYINDDLIKKIAQEFREGRKLFIVTTHFDAMRPMIWDIGYIAENMESEARELVGDIILASAAIPVLFPPVAIQREIDGKAFTELHVDGGMTRSVFAYPEQIDLRKIDDLRGQTVDRSVYVIMNGNSALPYEPAPVGVLAIAERATFGLLQNQAKADLNRIYYLSQRDSFKFHTIEIPSEFPADQSIGFEPSYMQELLNIGYEIGRQGDFWFETPPSLR